MWLCIHGPPPLHHVARIARTLLPQVPLLQKLLVRLRSSDAEAHEGTSRALFPREVAGILGHFGPLRQYVFGSFLLVKSTLYGKIHG